MATVLENTLSDANKYFHAEEKSPVNDFYTAKWKARVLLVFFLIYLKRKSKSCPRAWPSSSPMLCSTSASDELSMPHPNFLGRCIRLFQSLKQTKGYVFMSYSASESEAESMNSHIFHRLTSLGGTQVARCVLVFKGCLSGYGEGSSSP